MLSASFFDTNCYTVIRKDREIRNAPEEGVAILIRKEFVVDEKFDGSLTNYGSQDSVVCGKKC